MPFHSTFCFIVRIKCLPSGTTVGLTHRRPGPRDVASPNVEYLQALLQHLFGPSSAFLESSQNFHLR